MNAPALIPPAPAPASAPLPALRQRHDGWSPDRQRGFCEAIAEGETVEAACVRVGMAPSTAYALRRRAVGASFALAWDAARLLGRERLGDALHARALEGVTETITRPDGSTVTRHRFDTRLATAMLARADRHAQRLDGARAQAARLVAAEFDAFLDLLERGEGPARAGLFLGTRLGGEDDEALAPVMALARADTWLRTGAARGGEVDVADLDPAQRVGWTAEQWLRAEAAGLLALAPPPEAEAETVSEPPLSPLSPERDPANPVWWCEYDQSWRTRFPPPEEFFGEEHGRYGDADYSRVLAADEETVLAIADETRPVPAADAQARDAWFAELAAEVAADAGVEPDTAATAACEGEGGDGGPASTKTDRDDEEPRTPPETAGIADSAPPDLPNARIAPI